MLNKIFLYCSLLLITSDAFALMEIGADYGHQKKSFGSSRENEQVSKTYSASLAIYFFTLTALEFSFTKSEDNILEKNNIEVEGTPITITGIETEIESRLFGIGIKQALSSKKSRIRPAFSIGYARQLVEDKTFINFINRDTSLSSSIQDAESKVRSDSIMASFSLQLYLTKNFALKTSVRSVFPAFKFSQAKDDLKYTIGFSWLL